MFSYYCLYSDPSDDIVCAICGYGDKEKQLLLCDSSCGKAYHTFCIGLEEVPEVYIYYYYIIIIYYCYLLFYFSLFFFY